MTSELNRENMLLFFPSWEKPLSDKEITDFLNCEYEEEISELFPKKQGWKENCFKITVDNPATKIYTTKKEIRQDLKIIDNQLDLWLTFKNEARSQNKEIYEGYCEAYLDEFLLKKEELKAQLGYVGVKFDNNNLERAKQVPLSRFLDFNNAGFANCPFHKEKTGSFHKLPGKEKGHCFGCGRTGDSIDVVMALNNCTLPEALKILNF